MFDLRWNIQKKSYFYNLTMIVSRRCYKSEMETNVNFKDFKEFYSPEAFEEIDYVGKNR